MQTELELQHWAMRQKHPPLPEQAAAVRQFVLKREQLKSRCAAVEAELKQVEAELALAGFVLPAPPFGGYYGGRYESEYDPHNPPAWALEMNARFDAHAAAQLKARADALASVGEAPGASAAPIGEA